MPGQFQSRADPRPLPALLLALGLALGIGGCSRGPDGSPRPSPTPAKGSQAGRELWQAPREDAPFRQRVDAHAHFAAGVVHDARQEAALAEEQFAQSAAADPANEPLVIELAHRWLQQQQNARAVELLTLSAARPNASGLILGWQALALVQEGKTNQAETVLRNAIRKAPESLMAYHGLAQLYLNGRRTADALAVLDQGAARKDALPGFLVGLAEFLALASRSKSVPAEEANPRVLRWLEQVTQAAPAQPVVLSRMADTYKYIGELARAAGLYEELIRRQAGGNPGFELFLREQLVRLYLANGDKGKAATQLRAILRDAPTAPQAHLLLGAIASEEKRFAEAAECYEKALLLDANLESAYYDLAGVRLALGKPDEALEILGQARAKFGSTFLVEFYSGVAEAAGKDYTEALKHYTAAELQAKASEPSRLNQFFYFQVGAAFERMAYAAFTAGRTADGERHFAEAEQNLRRSLELAPDNAEVLNYLGYMWAERGVNLEEARRMIEKAVAIEPDSAAFLDSLAWVLYQLKRPAEALEPMLKAVKLSEKPDATLLDHLGDIYAALGRKAEAREAWRQSLAVEPNEAVKRKLETAP